MFLQFEKIGFYGALVSARRRKRHGGDDQVDSEELAYMPVGYSFNPSQEADRGLHPRTEAILNSLSTQQICPA